MSMSVKMMKYVVKVGRTSVSERVLSGADARGAQALVAEVRGCGLFFTRDVWKRLPVCDAGRDALLSLQGQW